MNHSLRVPSESLELAVETFGEGPPFVFAHGLTGNRHHSHAQLMPLADRYRIVSYDQRGHGDSTPITDPSLYNAERIARDTAAVMDALGIERAIIGGESMGAATALLFALQWPERVEKLLLTAPAFGDKPNPDAQRMKDMGKGIAKLGMDEFLKAAAVRQGEQLGWPPNVIAYVAKMFASHNPASLATALHTVPDWIILPDLVVLSRLQVPVFIVAWENDLLHPLELAQRMLAFLPNAHLVTIPPLPAIFADPPSVGRIYRKYLET